jgi:hypothetical protein
MIKVSDETDRAATDQIDKWAELNFDEVSESAKPSESDSEKNSPSESVDLPQVSSEAELEPLQFDDDEPINIEVSDRPFQKKPLPKLMLGLVGAGVLAVGTGAFINAGSQDAGKVFADNATKPQEEATSSNLPSKDPRDQTIGELQSGQASTTLKQKIDALNERKEKEAKLKAHKTRSPKIASLPVTKTEPTYSASPVASSSEGVPFRSIPSDPAPSSYKIPQQITPVARNYEPPKMQQPQQQPKLLAFGGIQEDKSDLTNPSPNPAAQPVSSALPSQPTGYTSVAYKQPQEGFAAAGNSSLEDQQKAFMGGNRLARISANASASGVVSSGAILPGRFSIQTDSPLSGIPAGSTIAFETKTVYPSGKVEAYAIGIVSGDYQRLQPIPAGTIALYSKNGKLLKAQRPSAGFLASPIGRGLVGALQGAAGRFLSTDSVISQTDSGTLMSQKAGSKGISDLAAGAMQGGLTPLLQSLPQGEIADKSFSIEPGKRVLVKVLQPFNFTF